MIRLEGTAIWAWRWWKGFRLVFLCAMEKEALKDGHLELARAIEATVQKEWVSLLK